jgi:hypothetical protein
MEVIVTGGDLGLSYQGQIGEGGFGKVYEVYTPVLRGKLSKR